MKSNRKYKMNEDEAVSAVIGVILMVAITVAIAATVYVYVSGMIGTSPDTAPEIQFVKDEMSNRLTVAKAAPQDLTWADVSISCTNGSYVNNTWSASTEAIDAGDYLTVTPDSGETAVLTIRHIDTNTLLGTWPVSYTHLTLPTN